MPAVDSLKGKLLVATPALFDPNFRRTVVLVGEHGEEGAMGLVLNRPTELAVSEAVPPLAGVAGSNARVHMGGPVQPEAVLVLAEFLDPESAGSLVVGDVGFASGEDDLEGLETLVRRARVFAGYSGWGPGQLEAELEEESWLVEPVEGADLFPGPGDDLFGTVLRRKGGTYRMLALMPEDPSVN
jgi:putative transcriptional regulator